MSLTKFLLLETAAVIGSGKFGLTLAKLLSENLDVLLYSRRTELIRQLNETHEIKGVKLSPRVRGTNSIEEVAAKAFLIFPVVPSAYFRSMMRNLGPHIKPSHILIHGTKGLDLVGIDEDKLLETKIGLEHIRTMSEVMLEESSALRVGCLSGPNLATEILGGRPTATVIASEYDEVIKLGQEALGSKLFFVFGSHDLKGAELAGAYKNVIAIAAGVLEGRGMGRNIFGMLITRGLREIVHFGKLMGSSSQAFVGTSGIGDLVATATSTTSRNFNFGYRMAKGETLEQILKSSDEEIEGLRTLKIAEELAKNFQLHAPITRVLYRVVFEQYDIEKAIMNLMRFPFAPDVDFL